MRNPVWKLPLLIACAAMAATCAAPQSTRPDALALLQKAAQSYARSPKSFRLESITVQTMQNHFERSKYTTDQTVLSAPNDAYRVKTLSGSGSTLRISDGKTVDVLQLESNVYIEHPAVQSEPSSMPDFYDSVISWKQDLSNLERKATMFHRTRRPLPFDRSGH